MISSGVLSKTETIVLNKVDRGSSRNVMITVVLGNGLPCAKASKSFSAHFGSLKNNYHHHSEIDQNIGF